MLQSFPKNSTVIFFPCKKLTSRMRFAKFGVILNHYFKTKMKFRLLNGDPGFPENCQVLLIDALGRRSSWNCGFFFPPPSSFLCWLLWSSLALRLTVWKCTAETSCRDFMDPWQIPSLSHHHWQLDALTETGNPAAKHCYNSLLPPHTLLLPPPDSSFVLVVWFVSLSFLLFSFSPPSFIFFLKNRISHSPNLLCN